MYGAGKKNPNNKQGSFLAWLHKPDTSHTVPNYCYTGFDTVRLRCQRLWMNECVCVHMNTPLSKKEHLCLVCRVCRRFCVQLTSFSLLSYLLAFLPWLFLLSFFRSDWDLSSESCFILCSIWYLLNVAWIRGMIHVSAGTPTWYLSEGFYVAELKSRFVLLEELAV